jgi:hypothetical protein
MRRAKRRQRNAHLALAAQFGIDFNRSAIDPLRGSAEPSCPAPPVKIPEWPGADDEMADGRPDDPIPIDPDAWSFNDDAESQEPQS